MAKEIDADYSQRFLLPPSIEDWVPSDHPARFIRLFVDSLKLGDLGFKERESEEGRPNYSNELLLKIWLYGYFHKIKSSRDLERVCKNEMPLIWLSGMNYPDHNTLWRFFRKNRDSLKNVFKQTVRFAVKSDMVGFALQAVDGTKVLADVSKRRSLHKQDLKKLLKGLDQSLEERFLEIEQREDLESGLPSYSLPKDLQEIGKLKDLIEKGLSELESEGTDHLSLTDRDSRMMKGSSGIKFGYNAQGMVDSKEQVIVGTDVIQEGTDNHQLTSMIEDAEENTGKKSQETIADAGYFSGEEIQKSEEKGYSVLVNSSSSVGKSVSDDKGDFSKSQFSYDAKNDHFVCPVGKALIFERKVKRKKLRHSVRIYRCKDFWECPNRDHCSQDPRGRSIERSPYDGAIKRQLQKQEKEGNRKLMSKRKTIVEPVFGWIKHNFGLNRWSYRGLKSVNAQWNLVCATINLKKLYKKWQEGGLSFG